MTTEIAKSPGLPAHRQAELVESLVPDRAPFPWLVASLCLLAALFCVGGVALVMRF